MAQLPLDAVRAILAQESEIPAALAWAERHGHTLEYDSDSLTVRLPVDGPAVGANGAREPYLLVGWLEDFDLLPPIWRFVDPRNGRVIGRAAYPAPGPTGSSVLHSNGVICAPWSRLAYADAGEGGPHSDWGAQREWKRAAPNYTHAETIPDMLDRIVREIRCSGGRMTPLPLLPLP